MAQEESTRRDINGVPFTTNTRNAPLPPAGSSVTIWENGVAKTGQLNSDGTVSKTGSQS